MKKGIQSIALIISILLFASCGNTASNNTASATKQDEPKHEKTLVRIDSLEGNGMKQSANFHLSGGDVRIIYAYKSDNDMAGMFSCYVLPKGHDFNKDGGIPDVMTSKLEEKSSSAITRDEGDYYLKVNAGGDFKVIIMEVK